MTDITPSTILNFWFSESTRPKHFIKDSHFDNEITERFLSIYNIAADNQLPHWNSSAEGCLAVIIILDQFPRNMFRNTPKAFATDHHARATAKAAIKQNLDTQLTQEQQIFLYMPFMHSETLEEQELSIQLYQQLGIENNLKFAIAHHGIIKEFNRFPHRNEIMNRESTPEELAFLEKPGSSF